jgi:hypothetical protein
MRFAGVLAVIPFLGNAAKNAVKGKKYAEMLDLAKKYMKIGGEAFSNLRTKLGKWACGNSFTPDTKVLTKAGLVAIASLAVGSKVLAYNEQNRTEGEYTVTAVHVHEDLTIINLSVETRDPKNDNTKLERIETTPGHPFHIVTFVDGKHRPKPEGRRRSGTGGRGRVGVSWSWRCRRRPATVHFIRVRRLEPLLSGTQAFGLPL